MKKVIVLLAIILLGGMVYEKKISIEKFDSSIKAKAIYVIDFETNEILYEENSKDSLAIASMTKLMTQYIVLNAIANETVTWDDHYSPSSAVLAIASKPAFANLKLKEGAKYTVKELFTASTVLSANDATIALSEIVAGSEENFVRIMNDQASYFKLNATTFFNATGLDGAYVGESSEKTNKSSARDVAIIASKLLKKHPQVLDFTNITGVETSDGVKGSTNLMLKGKPYEVVGVDGLKTGYTEEAELCFASTGIFNNRRIITVVIGVPMDRDNAVDSRFELTKELIAHFGK